ncbi:asialoglycoprotein receptor 1-like [Clarias gariepinus]|uniref:asialoglycoprotein receptor 1-like n=1 Tax=Clarias gariepinus TaxID=13013 RepID=UPI00234DB9BE|nr:asialoglycoprotein receptor 1-like [Clarias gariepinus]
MPRGSYNAADSGEGHGTDSKTRREAQHSGGDTAWSRCYRLTAVCEMLLCVLLLTAITVLWINYHILKIENIQLKTSNNNLTIERNQLQTSNNNLTKERNQLHTSNNNLTMERDQLQTSNNNLTIERNQLQTSNNKLTIERNQLQTCCNKPSKEREQLQTSNNNLTIERNQLQTSNNDLTIKRDQLQTSNNKLTIERNQLQTSNNNLTLERNQLQTCCNKPSKERERCQSDYNILITENNQLQTNYNNLTTERNQLQWEKKEILKFSKLGWIYFSLSLYYISTERKNWTESRENCRERGADLVIINSTEEQEFINKLPNYRRAWIGLSNRENKWKWVDDTTLITGFWGQTEPNGGTHENCVVTGDKTDPVMNWADYPCNRQHNWICEKRIFN